MSTKKVYGRTLINALTATGQVRIDRNFNYSDLKDQHKDFLVRKFLQECESEYLCEALVGQSEFGPLGLAYLMGEDAYCKALHIAIRTRGANFSTDEIEEFLQCEALNNGECRMASVKRRKISSRGKSWRGRSGKSRNIIKGMSIFKLFLADVKLFYKVVSDACNRYLEKTLYIQIDEALPGYLEDQRAIRQSIFDSDYAA